MKAQKLPEYCQSQLSRQYSNHIWSIKDRTITKWKNAIETKKKINIIGISNRRRLHACMLRVFNLSTHFYFFTFAIHTIIIAAAAASLYPSFAKWFFFIWTVKTHAINFPWFVYTHRLTFKCGTQNVRRSLIIIFIRSL